MKDHRNSVPYWHKDGQKKINGTENAQKQHITYLEQRHHFNSVVKR